MRKHPESLLREFCRYQRGSEMCEKLAQSLHHLTTSEERELFDFGKRGGEIAPIIMILDRKEDPVTPLLLQWTYQAMVHELIGIQINRVDLTQVPGVCPALHPASPNPPCRIRRCLSHGAISHSGTKYSVALTTRQKRRICYEQHEQEY